MFDHNVGVVPDGFYEDKKVDVDFFEVEYLCLLDVRKTRATSCQLRRFAQRAKNDI
jgi:hypothetical protein